MKQDIRYNPIDPSRENGRVYSNHPNKIDIDMQMFQEAFIAKRDTARLNTGFWIFIVCFVAFCAYIFYITG